MLVSPKTDPPKKPDRTNYPSTPLEPPPQPFLEISAIFMSKVISACHLLGYPFISFGMAYNVA